jgi:CheY-like chemotaxis protein
MATTCRIVIVDDNLPFSEELVEFIATLPDCTVVGCSETAEEGFDLTASIRPDVALVDIGLPGENGFWLTERIVALQRGTRVVVMSDAAAEEYEAAALHAGAIAFLPKREVSERLPDLLKPRDDQGPGTPEPAMPDGTRGLLMGMSTLTISGNQISAKAESVAIRHPLLVASALLIASCLYLGLGETLAACSVALTTLLYLFWHRAFAHHLCGQVGERWMWRGAPSSTCPHIEGRTYHSF